MDLERFDPNRFTYIRRAQHMIILIGGEKGGTGKSTIATNLAVCLAAMERDVLLLDTDRQGTAANWATVRGEDPTLPPVHCLQRYGNLFRPLQDLAGRYTDIVVDAGGRDTEELRTALVAADRLYCPIKASQSDLWTVEHVNELVGLAQGMNPELHAQTLLSMAPTNPVIKEADEAAEMLAGFEFLKLARPVIRDRKVFRDAMCQGRGVIEMADPKAITEIQALVSEVTSATVQVQQEHQAAS